MNSSGGWGPLGPLESHDLAQIWPTAKDGLPTPVRLAELLEYDPTTGRLTWRRTINSRAVAGSRAGNLDPSGYRKVRIDGVLMREHRVIWALETGEWPLEEIDHENRVKDDNRWSNLRKAGRPLNTRNHDTVSKNAKTLARAVRFVEGRVNPWRVEMKDGGRRLPSTSYGTLLDAAAAAISARNRILDRIVGG